MGKRWGAKRTPPTPEARNMVTVFTEQQYPEPSRQADLCVGGVFVLTTLEFVCRMHATESCPTVSSSVRIPVSSRPIL